MTSQLEQSEVRFCCIDFRDCEKITVACRSIMNVAQGSVTEVYLFNSHAVNIDVSKPLAQQSDPAYLSFKFQLE